MRNTSLFSESKDVKVTGVLAQVKHSGDEKIVLAAQCPPL